MTDIHDHETHAPMHPVVRLRPKGGKRLRTGAPWVYADELVMDRRTKNIPAGTPVTLHSPDREPLGTYAFNGESTIILRRLDFDPEAAIDLAWIEARLRDALALREAIFDAPFYRLVHAESDFLPGLVIDRFGDAAVIQPNAAWADVRAEELVEALVNVTGVKTVVVNGGSRARAQEGLDDQTRIVRGALDGPIHVPMNGATYLADLAGGQKTGLFFDQRPNHAFVAGLSKGKTVLDVFSHVGGFGLAALAGGATSAMAVDGSQAALDLATEGANVMGAGDRFETRKSDAFIALRALIDEGRQFDVVVCDPPAFAPTKGALDAGLRAYRRIANMGAQLVKPGGFFTMCSCSHAADLDKFRAVCSEGIRHAGRDASIIREGGAGADHPVHPALPETGYLKTVSYRLL